MLQKTKYTSETKCLAVFLMGNRCPLKCRVQILGLLWILLGNVAIFNLVKSKTVKIYSVVQSVKLLLA